MEETEEVVKKGFITRIKTVMKIGDSNGIILGKEMMKELNLQEGDEVVVKLKKRPGVREYFCFQDNYPFIDSDDINEVQCPICGRSDTIKLVEKEVD